MLYKFIYAAIVIALCSCGGNSKAKVTDKEILDTDPVHSFAPKPSASFKDTLTIDYEAAVFYHPDSLQLLQIKAQTDSTVFDGSMHEFFYQMRNARMVIKKYWPQLKIIEAKNYRYLLFIKKDDAHELIDLDTRNDAYGLFVFNGIKSPLVIDMTNIETEISFYLK